MDVPSKVLFTEYKTHYLFPSVYRQWTDRKHNLSKLLLHEVFGTNVTPH